MICVSSVDPCLQWLSMATMYYTKTYMKGYLVRQYYLSAKESDVTLKVGRQALSGHKFVLANKSIIFKTMFFGNFKEAMESEIQISEDYDLDAFKLVLKYCYFEELTSKDWPLEPLPMAIKVFQLAHFYRIKHLCFIAERKIINLISVDNLIDIFDFGRQYRRKRVIVLLRKFIKTHFNDIITSNMFLSLTSETFVRYLIKLMKCDNQLTLIKALKIVADKNNWKLIKFVDCIDLNKLSVDELKYLADKDSDTYIDLSLKKLSQMSDRIQQLENQNQRVNQRESLITGYHHLRTMGSHSDSWDDWGLE
ncbi:kelch-like protein 8 [Oppia nitens]|uniref:kelch-like protein 8 n=1 Tax=Oppia nitens TaxID=1686743 RepID=UPI0023DA4DA2|nr:kelch-like protein 8 [Oppia nitens]